MTETSNIDRLRALHAVSSAGTIAGAARALNYTPSAVSQHLSSLEREAGVALLDRTNKGVSLTAAGTLLARRSAVILDLVKGAFDDVGQIGGEVPTTVVVAAFPTAISSILLPSIERLPPSIRVSIVDLEPEQALRALADRTVDLAITDSYGAQSLHDGFHRVTLRSEPIHLVTSSRHRPRSLEACQDLDWALGGPNSRLGRTSQAICESHGFRPRIAVETDDHHVTFAVIAALDAASLLPNLALQDIPAGIRVARNVDTNTMRQIELVSRMPTTTSATLTAVGNCLLNT